MYGEMHMHRMFRHSHVQTLVVILKDEHDIYIIVVVY